MLHLAAISSTFVWFLWALLPKTVVRCGKTKPSTYVNQRLTGRKSQNREMNKALYGEKERNAQKDISAHVKKGNQEKNDNNNRIMRKCLNISSDQDFQGLLLLFPPVATGMGLILILS